MHKVEKIDSRMNTLSLLSDLFSLLRSHAQLACFSKTPFLLQNQQHPNDRQNQSADDGKPLQGKG